MKCIPNQKPLDHSPAARLALPVCVFVFLLILAGGATLSAAPFPFAQEDMTAPEADQQPHYAWAPALLYDIISSSSPEALDYLYDAAFATGPSMTPQLVEALKDDRTAEFAAQTLAFIGGEPALTALSKLVNDPRDLDLRRFYYGALGEFDTPQANQILVSAIANANNEPDRTVTEAAIIALTVHSNLSLLPSLEQAEAKLTDPVIQDDLQNALSIIQSRGHYLETPPGKNAGGSIPQAVRVYFMPALESEEAAGSSAPHAASPAGQRTGSATHPSNPGTHVDIQRLVFIPDKTRALAHVTFKEQTASADYKIVLQKRYGDWVVASVWLGNEEEAPAPRPATRRPAPPTSKK